MKKYIVCDCCGELYEEGSQGEDLEEKPLMCLLCHYLKAVEARRLEPDYEQE